MRENKAAAPGGGRPAGPDEQAAGDRALDRLALAIHGRNGIIKTGKQKCGSSRVRQHPRACAGDLDTYTTAKWPHRMEYYTTDRPFL